jgi:hypothetical protein
LNSKEGGDDLFQGTVHGMQLAIPRKVRETSLQPGIQPEFRLVLTFESEDGILLLHKRFVMFYRLCS